MNKPATDELNKLKEKFDYHVLMYNSPGYNSANDFKTKEYLKWIYEKLLLNFNTVVSAPKLSVYQSRLSTWEKRGIKPQIQFIQEIFQDVEDSCKQSPAQQHQQVKPLTEKINWKAREDILRTHLKKLKDKKFIDYDNIDSVMSGDEIAVFIKHKTFTAINQNILALYDLWNDKNYISDYTDREGKRQYKEFMENTFNWNFKGEIKNINHGTMGTLQDREYKKIKEVKKHLESILI